MWCTFGHVTPRNPAPAKPSYSTVRICTHQGFVPENFFFTLVTGPRRSLRHKLSDTRVYEPQMRARLGNRRLKRGS